MHNSASGRTTVIWHHFRSCGYDANLNGVPVLLAHNFATEWEQNWTPLFRNLKTIPRCDVKCLINIVNQEKSIASSFQTTMENAKPFFDYLQVKKHD